MLKIEKGVPLPTGARAEVQELDNALEKMKVGDSIFIPLSSIKIGTATHHAWAVLGRGNYSVHRQTGGFRIWKTKVRK